jgi:Rps23 Pro-64 3,4-dihydroxylase Tpa1-like proline 4-hydroxylase
MSGTGSIQPGDPTQGNRPVPPYSLYRNFLDEEMVSNLLEYAVEHETEFENTMIGSGTVDTSFRVSRRLRDFGPLKQEIQSKILNLSTSLIAELRASPFVPSKVEVELVAHGDGAFFKRHIDFMMGRGAEENSQRLVSGVYYFYKRPKGFSGGELRLYAHGTTESDARFVDLEPEWNTLIVFPSWALHEVRPVTCPSSSFIDSRFAINCWLHRSKSTVQS